MTLRLLAVFLLFLGSLSALSHPSPGFGLGMDLAGGVELTFVPRPDVTMQEEVGRDVVRLRRIANEQDQPLRAVWQVSTTELEVIWIAPPDEVARFVQDHLGYEHVRSTDRFHRFELSARRQYDIDAAAMDRAIATVELGAAQNCWDGLTIERIDHEMFWARVPDVSDFLFGCP